MAVDTAAKRASALRFGEPWTSVLAPPDGTVAVADRGSLVASYFVTGLAIPDDGWDFAGTIVWESERNVVWESARNVVWEFTEDMAQKIDPVEHHPQADNTYYAHFDQELPTGVTLTAPTVSSPDDATITASASIVGSDTTLGNGRVLQANRAVAVRLSGGTETSGSTTVPILVKADRSDVGNVAREGPLEVRGRAS